MCKIWFAAAAAILGLSVGALAAEEHGRAETGQQSPPTVPPASGATSSDLSRSGGVITPPAGIDPEKQNPPSTGATTPVIPPPGTPGGNPAVKPK